MTPPDGLEPKACQEDLRAAINIKMSLASSLITVALAFIGAEGGIAVFVLDKREHLWGFYLVAALASTALGLSVLFGGSGVWKAYGDGFHGKWTLSDKGSFDRQAIFCLIGAGLVLFSSILGSSKADSQRIDVHIAPDTEIAGLRSQIDKLSKEQEATRRDLATLMKSRSLHSKPIVQCKCP